MRTLGVDIGISSIGWALVEDGRSAQSPTEGALEPAQEARIIASGVRIFQAAENPKDKSSLASPRRSARTARRRTQRRAARLKNLKKYLSDTLNLNLKAMLAEDKKLPALFQTSPQAKSPWQLRALALDQRLSNTELARVILHIAKRRGYDDITYGRQEKDAEQGKILKAIEKNRQDFEAGGYRSIGEMLYKNYYEKMQEDGKMMHVRNRNPKPKNNKEDSKSKDSYVRCIARSQLRAELALILNEQQKRGNPAITPDWMKKILGDEESSSKPEREGMVFYQRALKGFEDKLGSCEFFNDQKRAFKQAPSAEQFIALTQIINLLKSLENSHGIVQECLQDSIQKILDEGMKLKGGLSYKKLKEILGLPESYQFKKLDYRKDNPESEKFIKLEVNVKLQGLNLDIKIQDKIIHILGCYKDAEQRKKELKKLGLDEGVIEEVLEKVSDLSISKTINLSLKALYEILPLMKSGKRYDEAIKELEEKNIFKPKKITPKGLLPPLEELAKEDAYFDITNPVVKRALCEFRKVLNAIVQKYDKDQEGAFHYLNIELSREIGASKKDREEMERRMKNNKSANDSALEEVKKLGLSQNPKNILKVKLWRMQNELCVYSGRKITIEDLKNENVEIDHIYPRSKSLDDSQNNKVLCLRAENQNKGNRTPYEFLGSDEQRWNEFEIRVKSMRLGAPRLKRLLNKNFKAKQEGIRGDWLARNLVDTGYISRALSKYVKYLKFLPIPLEENSTKVHVRVVSGSLTAFLRHYWGLGSKDRDHHLHHAQDAIIISFVNPSSIQNFSRFLKERELRYKSAEEKSKEFDKRLELPMSDFRNKVQEALSSILVSHRVSHKISGALHEESVRKREEYYKAYGNEEGLKRAIAQGRVRELNGGIVDNDKMVRVDVFKNAKNQYFMVPIYTYDFGKALPNKACVGGKDKEGIIKDWIEMNEDYAFCFSLFRGDIVEIQTKEMKSPVFAVYDGAAISTVSMHFEHLSRYAFGSEEERLFFTDTDGKKRKKKDESQEELASDEAPQDETLMQGKSTFSRTSCGIKGLKTLKKKLISPIGEIKDAPFERRQDTSKKRIPSV